MRTLPDLLARRRTGLRAWWALVAVLGVATAGAVVVLLTVPSDGPPVTPLLVSAIAGALFLLVGLTMPFLVRDDRRFRRAAQDLVAGGAPRDAAPAAELVVPAAEGRGVVRWQGRPVGTVSGPHLTSVCHGADRLAPPRWRVTLGGKEYPWLRLEMDGRTYLLAGILRPHLIEDTGRCWPVPRAATISGPEPVRVALPADLGDRGAVFVLRALAVLRKREQADRQLARAMD